VFDITTKIGFHALFLLIALSPILVLLAAKLILQLWHWVKPVGTVADHPYNAVQSNLTVCGKLAAKPLMQSISNRRYGYGKWGL